MKIEGACHCGYITYVAEIDPDKVGMCHCTDCQTLTGTAFRTSVAWQLRLLHLAWASVRGKGAHRYVLWFHGHRHSGAHPDESVRFKAK
jgi:hypothetical protein